MTAACRTAEHVIATWAQSRSQQHTPHVIVTLKSVDCWFGSKTILVYVTSTIRHMQNTNLELERSLDQRLKAGYRSPLALRMPLCSKAQDRSNAEQQALGLRLSRSRVSSCRQTDKCRAAVIRHDTMHLSCGCQGVSREMTSS